MVWQPGTLPQQTPHRERGNGRESRHQRGRQKEKREGGGEFAVLQRTKQQSNLPDEKHLSHPRLNS